MRGIGTLKHGPLEHVSMHAVQCCWYGAHAATFTAPDREAEPALWGVNHVEWCALRWAPLQYVARVCGSPLG